MVNISLTESVTGCLLGGAIADSLGLPYEGVSQQRIPVFPGPADRHRFVFGRGMISDDTEHSCLVAESLIASGFEIDRFEVELRRRLKWWFAALPAGIGLATARACLKMWLGLGSTGVYSAGNGPAMRSAVIGAAVDDLDQMQRFVQISTRLTHTDPKAFWAAYVVAIAAHQMKTIGRPDSEAILKRLNQSSDDCTQELYERLRQAVHSVQNQQTTRQFANGLGQHKGVSGYIYVTVPVVFHAWLCHHADYRAGVQCVVELGGDADTTAAILGGIIGAGCGVQGMPDQWVSGVADWPRSVHWMKSLSNQLANAITGEATAPIRSPGWATCLLRNLFFLWVVLFHGFRRLFPPYARRSAEKRT